MYRIKLLLGGKTYAMSKALYKHSRIGMSEAQYIV